MKIKLGVFFGGNTVEHEISVITYHQAISSIDEDKYEIVPIYIAKNGAMYTGDDLFELESFKDLDVLLKRCYKVAVINTGKEVQVVRVPAPLFGKKVLNTIDVAFPIVHGTNCEDGTLAGFLNLLEIPFVGPDVLSSALGMDKIVQKRVLRDANIPVVNFVSFYSTEYVEDEDKWLDEVEESLGFPVIVKPGNTGSSVGIRKAKTTGELAEDIEYAMEFSDRVLVEHCVENLQEINCSVIGDITETEASILEEPFFNDDILSYQDKYIGNGKTGGTISGGKTGSAKSPKMAAAPQKGGTKGGKVSRFADKKIPAEVSDETRDKVQELAKEVFKVLGCTGVCRIDFLIDKEKDIIYVNEINTIPGALSYYLWEATGKTFTEELDQVIDIALKKRREKEKLTFSNELNILAMQGSGVKGQKGTKGKM